MIENFTKTRHCTSFAHCETCRADAAWRAQIGAPDICPHEQLRKITSIRQQAKPVPVGGVGTELKKILAKFGIRATPNCSCNARAREMDMWGLEWCEENRDTILEWLREEARRRKLPFKYWVGGLILEKAIRNYRVRQKR